MTAALSEGIYDGPAQKVQDLFIRGRQEDTLLKVSMEDLPDTQHPDATPDIFWMTIVERKRGGAQDADGWRVLYANPVQTRQDIIYDRLCVRE
jgi:hypothetical protein